MESKSSAPSQNAIRLLLLGLDRNEAHARSLHSFTDGLSIRRIVLLPLDEWLDVGWRHQSNGMTQFADFSCSVVRAGTGFHRDDTGRLCREKADELPASNALAEQNLAGGIGPMRLEHVLRDVQPDRGNLRMDASFSDGSTPSPWHADAVRGRPPHHPLSRSRRVLRAAVWGIIAVACDRAEHAKLPAAPRRVAFRVWKLAPRRPSRKIEIAHSFGGCGAWLGQRIAISWLLAVTPRPAACRMAPRPAAWGAGSRQLCSNVAEPFDARRQRVRSLSMMAFSSLRNAAVCLLVVQVELYAFAIADIVRKPDSARRRNPVFRTGPDGGIQFSGLVPGP